METSERFLNKALSETEETLRRWSRMADCGAKVKDYAIVLVALSVANLAISVSLGIAAYIKSKGMEIR